MAVSYLGSKGVLRWATAGKVWRGLKAGVMEVPLAKYLLTEAVKSQAPKVKGRAITPLEDIYYAFQKCCNQTVMI